MTVVATTTGDVSGIDAAEYVAYRGIPFAARPVGSRRFAAPAPVEPWSGVRTCVEFGAIAPQPPGLFETMMGLQLPQSEDCLTLNVAGPRPDGSARAVLVWLHGGGFVTGAGSLPWFDPAAFVRRGIIVVTVNYRLGLLGWANLSAASVAAPTNRGLLDQIAALRWVHDNIAAFGGDASAVTVAGESAGAMSVAALLSAPDAAGLFARAMLWSGSGHDVLELSQSEQNAAILYDALGLDPSDTDTIRDRPVDALLAAQDALMARIDRTLPFLPVVDGSTVRRHPTSAVARGAARGVPLLLVTNRDEIGVVRFMGDDVARKFLTEYHRRFEDVMGDRAQAALAAYRAAAPASSADDVDIAVASDLLHHIPSIRLAEAQSGAGGEAYLGLFSWPTPILSGRLGACHALDLPFVFDSTTASGAAQFLGDAPPRALAADVNAAVAAFVTSGRPDVAGRAWPKYEVERRSTMVFHEAVRVQDDPLGARRRLWDGLLAPVVARSGGVRHGG